MNATLILASFLNTMNAPAPASGCTIEPKLVTYYKPQDLPNTKDTRCDLKDGKCKKLELKGYLYLPPPTVAAKKPYPVIVQSHGSGEKVGDYCEFGSYFAELGYAVFMPHRRGHGDSTGVGLGEYTSKHCSKPGQGGPCKMEYLHKQVADVRAAVDFMKKRGDVDPQRIALSGHSYGGIVTVFANTEDLGQKAVIDFAGGSQSWEGNDAAAAELIEAVRKSVAPVYFFEPL